MSESPAQSAAEVAGPSRRSVPRRDLPSVGPQLVVHRLQDAIFFGYNFVDCPSRVERRNVVRLALAQNSSESREKAGSCRVSGS